MPTVDELHARINLALSVLNHRRHCDACHHNILVAIAALEGVPIEVLVREEG